MIQVKKIFGLLLLVMLLAQSAAFFNYSAQAQTNPNITFQPNQFIDSFGHFQSQLVIGGQNASEKGEIIFEPNVIPELNITFVEEFFRFKWRENRFDLKLLINCEGKNHSLRDFWELTDGVVNWEQLIEKATDSMYEFGYNITDIPREIADNVEYLIWKIEDFDAEQIEVETIELPTEEHNITRFHLPDNLVLSYEDLWLYNFTVSHPNKLDTIVKNVKGKSSWNLDPITFSADTITAIGGSEGSPLDFEDLWDADKAGTHTIVERTGITGNDGDYVAVNDTLKPADIRQLGTFGNDDLWFYVTNWQNMNSCVIRVRGTNLKGDIITDEYLLEDRNFPTGIGKYYLGQYGFHTVTYTKVASWNGTGGFDYDLTQGQWGVVWKTGDTQFTFDAKIVLGNGTVDGTTWFADSDKQILFSSNAFTANWQIAINIRRYVYVTMGTLVNTAKKITKNGVSFFINGGTVYHFSTYNLDPNTHDRQLYLYSCSFSAPYDVYNDYVAFFAGGNARIWNVLVKHGIFAMRPFAGGSPTTDFFNVVMARAGSAGLVIYGSTGVSVDHFTIEQADDAIWTQQSTSFTIKNVYSRGSARIFKGSTNWQGPAYLINFDVDDWTFIFVADATGEVYRQYEFDLTVTYPNGTAFEDVNVTISNEYLDYSDSWLTNSDGQIPTQTYSMGHYNQTGGDTIYDYNPYRIIIRPPGYATMDYYFDLEEKTDWQVAAKRSEFGGGMMLAGLGVGMLGLLALMVFIFTRRKW